MKIRNSICDLRDEIASYRHELHQNPQTAYEETFAHELITKKLSEWGIPYKTGYGKTGVVATIEGTQTDSGIALGFRADIDALDITEQNEDLPYKSKNPGKMHACGHDGHTAIMLGVAKYLSENNHFNGKVHLIFQPAEEGQAGALTMMKDGLFKDFPCDYIFGIHNWPWFKIGDAGTRVGPLMASVDKFEIVIQGKGGHAAFPHETVDPIVAGAQLVSALQSIVSRNIDPVDTAVVSVTNFNAGTGAHNVIDDKAVISGTVRAFQNETRQFIKDKIQSIAQSIVTSFGATATIEYSEGTDPTVNHEVGVSMAARAAVAIIGDDHLDTNCDPCMGGEDFGAFLNEVPGAFLFVGQGTNDPESSHNQGLHHPQFNFNDDIIPVGIEYFVTLAEQCMPLK